MEYTNKLKDKVAVVAGATRGAGRGIACMLSEAGATVYCTGRRLRGRPSDKHRPETIEETAEIVTAPAVREYTSRSITPIANRYGPCSRQ